MVHIKKVLCPVDFSDPSREAMHFAVDLAQRYGAEVVLLHVYQVPAYAFPEGMVLAGPDVLANLVDRIARTLAAWREDAAGRAAGLTVAAETAMGVAHTEILRVARERKADLIVVGTHGRTGLAHVFLGSVAERVLRTAPCPVLTVRPAAHRLEVEPTA
jgi:nucleotide-binding universal stress UspA family protein